MPPVTVGPPSVASGRVAVVTRPAGSADVPVPAVAHATAAELPQELLAGNIDGGPIEAAVDVRDASRMHARVSYDRSADIA